MLLVVKCFSVEIARQMKHRPPFDVCVCMCGACEEQEDETIKSNHWIEIIDTKNVINSAHSSKSRNAVTLVFLLCFRHISQMNSFFFDFTPVKKNVNNVCCPNMEFLMNFQKVRTIAKQRKPDTCTRNMSWI